MPCLLLKQEAAGNTNLNVHVVFRAEFLNFCIEKDQGVTAMPVGRAPKKGTEKKKQTFKEILPRF